MNTPIIYTYPSCCDNNLSTESLETKLVKINPLKSNIPNGLSIVVWKETKKSGIASKSLDKLNVRYKVIEYQNTKELQQHKKIAYKIATILKELNRLRNKYILYLEDATSLLTGSPMETINFHAQDLNRKNILFGIQKIAEPNKAMSPNIFANPNVMIAERIVLISFFQSMYDIVNECNNKDISYYEVFNKSLEIHNDNIVLDKMGKFIQTYMDGYANNSDINQKEIKDELTIKIPLKHFSEETKSKIQNTDEIRNKVNAMYIEKWRKEKLKDPTKLKIVMVGNGPSVKSYPAGDIINSADIVIRFNGFKTRGHEEYVGNKIDIWFLNTHINANKQRIIDHHNRNINVSKFVLKGVTQRNSKRTRSKERRAYKKSRSLIKRFFPDSELEDIGQRMIELKTIINLGEKNPTMGAMGLDYMLNNYKTSFYLHGFDFILGLYNSKHYYNTPCRINKAHRPHLENEYFHKFLDNKRLIILSDDVLDFAENVFQKQNQDNDKHMKSRTVPIPNKINVSPLPQPKARAKVV